jgi:hypothetical protein
VAQHHRALTATAHHGLTTRRKARAENTGKLGKPADSRCPEPETKINRSPASSTPAHPWIEA